VSGRDGEHVPARRRRIAVLVALLVAVVVVDAAGCATGRRHRGLRRLAQTPSSASSSSPAEPTARVDEVPGAAATPGTPVADGPAVVDEAPLKVVDVDVRLQFAAPAGPGGADVDIDLRGRLTRADGARGPGVVIVPGAGDVSRDGTRRGDGVITYRAPVDVTRQWASVLASRGAVVLAWDKRTCGANDAPGCTTNPQGDVDARGPEALARDVDAACALVRADPAFDGRLVLLAHGQGAQVALASSCAATAGAIVLLSPIPRAVDSVLVDALVDRQAAAQAAAKTSPSPAEKTRHLDEAARLKNQAGSRAASFASMKEGRFAPDARVDGATLAFWTGWIDLTARTPSLLAPVRDRVVVVVGEIDRQLSAADRAAAAALPARTALVVPGADHHLLVEEQLPPTVTEPLLQAVDALLAVPGS
jgi:alpha-beta hydrolase superfamily lysophospholipase